MQHRQPTDLTTRGGRKLWSSTCSRRLPPSHAQGSGSDCALTGGMRRDSTSPAAVMSPSSALSMTTRTTSGPSPSSACAIRSRLDRLVPLGRPAGLPLTPFFQFGLDQWAHPMFGRSDHCPGVIYDEAQHARNAAAGKPTNFLWFDRSVEDSAKGRAYIASGERENLHKRYKCRIRSPGTRSHRCTRPRLECSSGATTRPV